jgi:hypothetical protein
MMLDYEDAKALVFENVIALEKWLCPLNESQGLALSEDILAPHGMPLFDNSAVDGYAVQSADLAAASKDNPVRLEKLPDLLIVQHIHRPLNCRIKAFHGGLKCPQKAPVLEIRSRGTATFQAL